MSNNNIPKDIYTPELASQRNPVAIESFDYNILLDALIEDIYSNPDEMAGSNHPFLEFVRQIESSGDPQAFHDDSKAAGLYQFRPRTVTSAKKRASMIGISDDFIKNLD